jgi:ferritin
VEIKDPKEWFENAVKSKRYAKDVINKMLSCVSDGNFIIEEFIEWMSEESEKEGNQTDN